MHLITIRDQVCNVMASLTKTFVSPDIVLLQKSKPCLRQRREGKRDRQAPRPQLIECSCTWDHLLECSSAGSSGLHVVGSHPGIGHPSGA